MFTKKGLYKENTRLKINLYSSSHAHSSLHTIKGVGVNPSGIEEIELTSGDQFIQAENLTKVDLLKLDIEGAEMDALVRLTSALNRKMIRLVQFEYGYINITTKHLLADYYDFFAKFGYLLGKIYPKEVTFREYSFHHEDFIGPNFVAVHQSDRELITLLSKKG